MTPTIAISAAALVATAPCPASGPAGPGDLHRQWILDGWERKAGDPPFVFAEKLGRFYADGNDLHLYDSFDPQHRVATSAAEYASFWEGPFNTLRSAQHGVSEGPDVALGADLAATTLEFVARLQHSDGKTVAIRARSSLVWRCSASGWRIVREQNAVREVPAGELEDLL